MRLPSPSPIHVFFHSPFPSLNPALRNRTISTPIRIPIVVQKLSDQSNRSPDPTPPLPSPRRSSLFSCALPLSPSPSSPVIRYRPISLPLAAALRRHSYVSLIAPICRQLVSPHLCLLPTPLASYLYLPLYLSLFPVPLSLSFVASISISTPTYLAAIFVYVDYYVHVGCVLMYGCAQLEEEEEERG